MQPRIYRNGNSKVEKYSDKKIRFGRAAHNCIQFTRPELGVQYPEAIIIHDAPEDNRKERAVQRQEMNIKQLKSDLAKNAKDTRAWFYLGNTYLEGKKIEEAHNCFDEYFKNIKVETDEAYQAYLHKALAYKEEKKYQESLKCLYQANRVNSLKRDSYLLIGDMLMELDRVEEAIHNYNTALSIKAPVSRMFSNGGTYTWLPHQQLAQAYKKQGNIEMAVSHLKICLGYVNMDGWRKELNELTQDKKNILIVDHIGSFTDDFRKYLENNTYNVIKVKEWSNTLALWADCIFVEWADINACNIGQFKAKTVIRIHGYEAYLNQHLLPNIPWDCKGIIYVAEHIKEIIGKDGNVVFNGVDTDKFYIKNHNRDSKNVGYVGYLNGKKNPMRLANIIKNNPEMKFNLRIDWQDPFLERSFNYETKECKNIVYHGRYDDINEFYNQMSYIISTSDIESFSYQIAEGMSAGCTPLIYNWNGAKDIWRKDMIFKDMPKFELKDMNEMREYIINNYPLHRQMMEMERILVG
jgi:predicted negative regulator of RcsB-dependent stress response